jgi:hypothetical protein
LWALPLPKNHSNLKVPKSKFTFKFKNSFLGFQHRRC